MGILMGIISFVLGFAINLIDAAVEAMLGAIGYDMSTFLTIFPFAQNAMDTFVACGLTFLMLGLLWQTLKGFGAPFGIEYENPLHIVGKVALTWFAVVNLTEILNIITGFFRIVLSDMNSMPLNPSFDAEYAIEGFASNLLAGLIADVTGTSGLLLIVYIICVIILGWKFIKLLIEMIERYIVYCFICLIGPVFVSTAAFKSSKNIADTWFRAFFGQSLLILLNTWSAKMFLSYCQVFTQNIAGIHVDGIGFVPSVVLLFFGFAFLNFASRIDSFLRILGLNTAHTGSGMAQSALGGLTKLVMGVRGLQGMGGALSGAATAAKAAGGIGTAAGMKAAATSFMTHSNNSGSSATSASTVGGEDTNRRTDGTKTNAAEPGRRTSTVSPPASGDLLKQESTPSSQIMSGQKEINDALSNKINPSAGHGIGGTNGIKGTAAKMDYTDGGVMASAGKQGELANKFHGGNKPMGEIKQDAVTANAVRAAATGAERFQGPNGESMPISSYKGAEAAAAMNGVTAFGNDNLKSFNFTEDADGASFISGQNFKDGSSVSFDNVEGGIASGVYTDADGNSTAFDLVHDNAVDSQKAAVSSGVPGAKEFDTSSAVGRIGDGSGETGFYVVPKQASASDATTTPYGHNQTYAQMDATVDRSNTVQVQQASDKLTKFIGNCNPVDKSVSTLSDSKVEQMQRDSKSAVPRTKQQTNKRGKS